MRYVQQVDVVCGGCGSLGETVREVVVIGGQEFGRVHHPKGWEATLVRPSVLLASAGQVPVDPFAPAPEVAAKTGQPVEEVWCPPCQKKMAVGARKLVELGNSDEKPEPAPASDGKPLVVL